MCVEMHWILNFIKTYNMKILQVAFLLLLNIFLSEMVC